MKKKLLIALAVIILAVIATWLLWPKPAHAPDPNAQTNKQTSSQQASNFNKNQHPIDEANSIWVVVNKQRPLQPKDYAPDDLVAPNIPLRISKNEPEMQMRKEVATALETMVQAAKKEAKLELMLASAYRPYTMQENLYKRYVDQQGQAEADRQSARPGHSEHQTGLAVDLEPVSGECEIEICFADLPEGKWLAANAYKYGFVIRYAEDKEDITGYMYEPWHLRYVGKELAAEMNRQKVYTLEELFDLPAAPSYN